MLLHLIELAGQDGGRRVFLAVHGLLFHGGVQLGERHGRGVGAQRVEGVEEQGALDHAQLQACQIIGRIDGAARVGYMAKAVFPEAQADQALVGQHGQQLLAEGAVEQGVGFGLGVEGERQIQHAKGLDQRHQRGGIRNRHLQRAAAQGRGHAHVVAQGAAGKQLGVHLAAALGLQALGKVAHGLGLRVVVAQANADLEGVFLDLGRDGGGKGGQQRGSKRQGFSEGLELHGVLSPLEWLTPLARPSAYAALWGKPSWTQGEG
ncbi:hypothetical protein D3C71_1348240 [compost metagenome]